MKRIQFGWTIPNGPRTQERAPFLASIHQGFDIVRGHFGSAWLTDHLQFGATPVLEGWTALTYYAAQHPEFDFGHAVLCQSYRNPALLAKMATTFQYLSNGHFILGIGAGWKEDEYLAYDYKYPSAGTRIEELEETLHIVKALWHDEQATFEGKHYSVREAYAEPKPPSIPTIMIGGSKPRMLRVIARHADWWNVSWTGIKDYRAQVEECEKACEAVGRDSSTLRRTWFGGCLCAPTEAEVNALNMMGWGSDNAFVGTPAQILEQMQPFLDLGVDYFMLSCGAFPELTTLETLVSEVLPKLNS